MHNQLDLEKLPLEDLLLIKHYPISDHRGFLERLYCQKYLQLTGMNEIAQINFTYTQHKGTVRGMHFQLPPHSEIKIVRCLRGKIFDVAIDLRKDSPTFLKWHSVILEQGGNISLLIPRGFAHGFQTLTNDCELLYFHSNAYNKAYENGISPTDPLIGIRWPLAITNISDRDRAHSFLTPNFQGLTNEM